MNKGNTIPADALFVEDPTNIQIEDDYGDEDYGSESESMVMKQPYGSEQAMGKNNVY